jgi:hypothetical protein
MAQQIVQATYLSATSDSFGYKLLRSVKSFTVGDKVPLNDVKTITREGVPIAFRQGTKDSVDVDLEQEIFIPEEYDFRELMRRKESFQMKYEEDGSGKRYRLVDCRVFEVSKKVGSDGENMLSVKIKALQHVPE